MAPKVAIVYVSLLNRSHQVLWIRRQSSKVVKSLRMACPLIKV